MIDTLECEALLLDLDGVLADSTRCVQRIWKRWADTHGTRVADIARVAHGRRIVETLRIIAPDLDAEAEAELLAAEEARDPEGLMEMPGAADLVRALSGAPWAVVTSGNRAVATMRLTHVGIPIPKVLVTAEDVSRGKPDPEGYLAAARRLGVEPREALVIEDAPPGIEAARAAGMRVIGVASTHALGELAAADMRVARLTDLSWEMIEPAPGRTRIRLSRRT